MSTFGHYFRVTTYGESHGLTVGCTIDGCPPGMALTEDDIQPQMNRRRPGQSAITTPRNEKDRVTITSGVENGYTLGSPIHVTVKNEDQRPKDYGNKTMDVYPRPSHADFTYIQKYGVKSVSGGGRSSARETIARVAAGAIAEKYLRLAYGIEIVAFVSAVGTIALGGEAGRVNNSQNPEFLQTLKTIDRKTVDSFAPVRCPDEETSKRMAEYIEGFRDRNDSIGGVVTCVVRNVPAGLGEPCFDKLEAKLAHAMLSIPASKGFEVGSGYAGTTVPGSIHNDPFIIAEEYTPLESVGADRAGVARPKLTTKTNNSGGIQGGISNAAPIYFTVAFKPPATISQQQSTATYDGASEGILEAKGRHDPCVVPRAVPIVESMAAITVLDMLLAQHARAFSRTLLPERQI